MSHVLLSENESFYRAPCELLLSLISFHSIVCRQHLSSNAVIYSAVSLALCGLTRLQTVHRAEHVWAAGLGIYGHAGLGLAADSPPAGADVGTRQ